MVPTLLLSIFSFTLTCYSMTLKESAQVIEREVASYGKTDLTSFCESNDCCTVSSSKDSCSLNSFSQDASTIVYPGGESRCIFSTSTPFAFQVFPGESDKLVFYFQGGGACWNQASTLGKSFCTTDCYPQEEIGLFDRSDERNEFRNHTIIHLMYCSGDVWGGNVVRGYNDENGEPVMQVGLINAQTVLDWTMEQQRNGGIAAVLTDLVVMGCSAGSLGAQFWGSTIAKSLKWEKAAIVPDSYAGYFPEGTEGPLMHSYGFCSASFLTPELSAACNAETMLISDAMTYMMSDIPSVPYAYIQSKVDECQMSFYISVGATTGADVLLTPSEFYAGVNNIFETYNKQPNFLTYLVDGSQHCFTPLDYYYSADALGPVTNGENSSIATPMLSAWTADFPLDNADRETTICDGTITSNSKEKVTDNTYCDEEYVPKTFVEQYAKK